MGWLTDQDRWHVLATQANVTARALGHKLTQWYETYEPLVYNASCWNAGCPEGARVALRHPTYPAVSGGATTQECLGRREDDTKPA